MAKHGGRAIVWWRKALADGQHCARKGRSRFFSEYLEEAIRTLQPGDLEGPCRLIYRLGFRAGFDSELDSNRYLRAPAKRDSLSRKH